MLVFLQLFDPTSSTYTFLLVDGGEAVLIDTVFDQERRNLALLRELNRKLPIGQVNHPEAAFCERSELAGTTSSRPRRIADRHVGGASRQSQLAAATT